MPPPPQYLPISANISPLSSHVSHSHISSLAFSWQALEELDNLRRENRRLLRDLDSGKQSIQGLQQSEFEILRKLKEVWVAAAVAPLPHPVGQGCRT